MDVQIKEAKVFDCKEDGVREQMQKEIESSKLVLAFYEKRKGDNEAQLACHIDLSGTTRADAFETLGALTTSFAMSLYNALTRSFGAEPEVALSIMQHFWMDAQGNIYNHDKVNIDEALDRVYGAEKKEAHVN